SEAAGTRPRAEGRPLRRNELTSCIALGAFVILAAICALRFDLASLLLPDVPASAEVQRAAAMKRVSAGGAAALDLRPVEDGTGTQLSGQSVRITIASSARPTPADVKVAAPLMPAPAPITFPYDEASVTAAGRQQAAALSDFLRQRKLDVVTLSGHADERGSD